MFTVPKQLKDFAVWLNPTNLKVFNKMEMVRLAQTALRQRAKPLDPHVQARLSEGLGDTPHDLSYFALRVYFYQLFKGGRISLDLRHSRFEYNEHWWFKGGNLAYEFNEDLRQALVATYVDYYEEQASELRSDLEKMGLIQNNWDEKDKLQLECIFMNHFRQGEKTKQHFKLKDLIDSFSQIFFFIKSKKAKVPSEFSLLGVYLTSLYMTLDRIDGPIDVQDCFLRAKAIARPSS